MMSIKFCPRHPNKQWTIKRRRLGDCASYNFRERVKWYPAGWGYNKQILGGIFGRLHYFAYHAPAPVRKKWRPAYYAFYKQHFGTNRASVRYLNKWSVHGWL